MRYALLALLVSFPLLSPQTAMAQKGLTSVDWCADQLTVCISGSDTRGWISGVRLIYEPNLGQLFQAGDDRFENAQLTTFQKFAAEVNVVQAWLGLQIGVIFPGAVTYDADSPLNTNGHLRDPERKVRVEWGWTLGASALDGIIAAGFGQLRYDRRDFVDPGTLASGFDFDNFGWLAVQPVSAVKKLFKTIK